MIIRQSTPSKSIKNSPKPIKNPPKTTKIHQKQSNIHQSITIQQSSSQSIKILQNPQESINNPSQPSNIHQNWPKSTKIHNNPANSMKWSINILKSTTTSEFQHHSIRQSISQSIPIPSWTSQPSFWRSPQVLERLEAVTCPVFPAIVPPRSMGFSTVFPLHIFPSTDLKSSKVLVFFWGWTEGIYIEGWANLYECAKPDPAVALEYGWGITQDDPGEQEMNIDDFWLRFGNILPISVNQNWSIQYMIQ